MHRPRDAGLCARPGPGELAPSWGWGTHGIGEHTLDLNPHTPTTPGRSCTISLSVLFPSLQLGPEEKLFWGLVSLSTFLRIV